jgi:SAM-dependent methyltransferase
MVAIVKYDREHIYEAVQLMYTEVATLPEKTFHFPTGRPACVFVGYPEEQLDAVPARAVESFAGVGYPFAVRAVREGNHVLDIGSGSGTDALIAARLVGPRGKVYGLDMTAAMREKLRKNADDMGVANVTLLAGNAEEIPLPDGSVDVVTSNGVLNLVPDKERAFAEIFRVLRPGGRVQIADIVVGEPISEQCRQDPQLWAECVVGALLEEDYLDTFRRLGFEGVAALSHLDYFSKSASPETRRVAASFKAHTVVMKAVKPLLAI